MAWSLTTNLRGACLVCCDEIHHRSISHDCRGAGQGGDALNTRGLWFKVAISPRESGQAGGGVQTKAHFAS